MGRDHRICKDAVKTMLGFELGHVGINCQDAGQAEQTAKALCAIFGFEYKAGNSSDFAGSAVECNKAPGRAPTATSPSAPTMWTAPSTTWAFRA